MNRWLPLLRFLLPGAVLVLILWTFWGNTALMVHPFTISGSGIPKEFDGFRIAQVSDLHNAEFGKDNRKLLALLEETKPDLIVLTGDLIDLHRTDIPVALQFARAACGIAPVLYVTGNHEAFSHDTPELLDGLREAGVEILQDSVSAVAWNGQSIRVIGLSDPLSAGRTVPDQTGAVLSGLFQDAEGYRIVLSHRPELFETYVACGADLVFTGHAHGGQFRLPFVGGLYAPNQGLFPKYDAGLYTEGHTQMIVSRGLGNSVFPFRFNNRPEIVLVELSAS